ncbi:DMT family transporter [Gammaproteobacteria bacterium]|nr:DMT family transporter [Gammaproteobacteria bacterium]MDA9784904.1 DMT family transporter [Gammaproteobacteria bacterium]MDA9876176.1 DMT family transporter [Gammaproteobacteria bacterium]MDB0069974.1 DMT family transporter [Gammaproteobacteria bacterium]MDB4194591.1 DMT family transporter [Gammaproteobacteria bacterium]|tara:strand:+ start:407 stop:1273 length:867 start_codon:yes stop_codon:yes gene_type:complete
MELKNWILLILLGAVWGSAFMFIKISADDFGPILLVNLRLLLAGALFLPFLLQKKYLAYFKSHFSGILILGIFSNAFPFTMFSYASLGATSNMLGILNGTTAFMTMVVAYFWLKESITPKQIFGIILGFLGILVLVNPANGSATIGASGFALVGALSYSFSGVYIQKYQLNANKFVLIGWAMLFGGLFLTPLSFFNLPDQMPDNNAIAALLWLGIVSTGIAYLGYIRLIEQIGAVRTSTVTYLLPVFSIIWGSIFLQEKITWIIFGGFIFVMIGMYFANNKNTKASEK